MGNKQQKEGVQVAIFKEPGTKIYDPKDYNKFFREPDDIICSVYDSFDSFIEKQSQKKLRHIIIIDNPD